MPNQTQQPRKPRIEAEVDETTLDDIRLAADREAMPVATFVRRAVVRETRRVLSELQPAA